MLLRDIDSVITNRMSRTENAVASQKWHVAALENVLVFLSGLGVR